MGTLRFCDSLAYAACLQGVSAQLSQYLGENSCFRAAYLLQTLQVLFDSGAV